MAGAAVLAVLAALALAEQADLRPASEDGLLVLRSGEVFQGTISQAGGLYYVAVPGGEVRIKAEQVDFCCGDLVEAYERKRAALPPREADAHLALAQWCLRHGLVGPADRELADAELAEPDHPAIELLRRRLELAEEPPPEPARATPIAAVPSHEELDRLVQGMPPGTVETFTGTIQPFLLNHCGAAECHGPGTQSRLELLRLPPARTSSRRLTQRNLHSILSWIDQDDPAASPLLTVPLGPHGTAEEAVFAGDEAQQYERIAQWVAMVSQRPAAEVPESVILRVEVPPRAMPGEGAGEMPDAEASRPGVPADAAPSAAGASVRRGAPPELFVPVDPFDPEVFNRRYFGEK